MEAKSWSEEHESHQAYNGDECAKQHEVIRGCGMKLLYVNVADIWRERNVWYQGRSRQQVETEYEPCSNNEWREVSRGHSTKTVANVMGRTEL